MNSRRHRWMVCAGMCLCHSAYGAELTVNRFANTTELLFGGDVFHITPAMVSEESLLVVPNSTVHLIFWNETVTVGSTTRYYAISLNGQDIATVRPTSYGIKLKFASFDPLVGLPSVHSSLASPAGTQVHMVQFETQPLDVFRERIAALGGTIYDFITDHTYIVVMAQSAKTQIEALPYVRWVGPYHPAYRLEPFLSNGLVANSLPSNPSRYNILVLQSGLSQKTSVASQIQAMGGTINRLGPGGRSFEATLTPVQLREVARNDNVAYIDRWTPPKSSMDNARRVSGANYLRHNNSTIPFDGTGVIGEVLDAKLIPLNHPAFNLNRLEHGEPRTIPNSHGMSVYGILFGNGEDANPAGAKGLMPGAQGIFADFCRIPESACPEGSDPFFCDCQNQDIDETVDRYCHTCELVSSECCSVCCSACPCPSGEYEPYPSFNAVFQSNSWGANPLGYSYGSVSRELDAIASTYDLLICQAQGNFAGVDSHPQAWAKNVVSVGGFYHIDSFDYSDDQFIPGTASFGPAPDGRVKPDLSNFYDKVYTTKPALDAQGNVQYNDSFNGTSAATPITCGNFGLFFQMWKEGVFNVCRREGCSPSGGSGSVFEERPPMSLAKAMIINTARPFDFLVGVEEPNHTLTRDKQGWGVPMVGKVLALARRDAFLKIIDETEVLTELKKDTYTIAVPTGAHAIRVTLVYTDPACTSATLACAGNDLSVRAFCHANGAHDYWGNFGL
ncbi:MAG: S8 family serine peptidase, partial [Bacteroidota bacterium]